MTKPITPLQRHILANLPFDTTKETAALLDVKRSTLSTLALNLSCRGLLTKETVREPKRHPFSRCTITDAGRKMLGQ